MVFPGVQKTTWTYHPKAKAYYFHRFYDFQPDLNIAQPRGARRRCTASWGSGCSWAFRASAWTRCPSSSRRKGADAPARRALPRSCGTCASFLQWRTGDAILLARGERAPETGPRATSATRRPDAHDVQLPWSTRASSTRWPRGTSGRSSRRSSARGSRERDLAVGALPPQQRRAGSGPARPTSSASASSPSSVPSSAMQLYDRGIRRRLAPMLNGDRRRLELAYSLLFTLPGTPVIRYGDEIGMGDDLSLTERSCVRTPMQWSTEPNAGFSTAKKTRAAGHLGRSVRLPAGSTSADQKRDPDLAAQLDRAHHPRAQGVPGDWLGDLAGAPRPAPATCSPSATTGGTTRVLFLHNFDPKAASVTFGAGSANGGHPRESALRRSLAGGRARAAPGGARGLRLPLVPRGRARLHPPALPLRMFAAHEPWGFGYGPAPGGSRCFACARWGSCSSAVWPQAAPAPRRTTT